MVPGLHQFKLFLNNRRHSTMNKSINVISRNNLGGGKGLESSGLQRMGNSLALGKLITVMQSHQS